MSGEEVTPGLAITVDRCFSEDHGHHLQKEKAVTAKTFSLRPMTNPVNALEFDVSKSEGDVHPLT